MEARILSNVVVQSIQLMIQCTFTYDQDHETNAQWLYSSNSWMSEGQVQITRLEKLLAELA